MLFHLKTDAVFEAVDLEDALRQLGDHFTKLSNGILPPDMFIADLTEFKLGPYVLPPPPPRTWKQAWGLFDKKKD